MYSGEVIKTVNLPELPDTLELIDQWPRSTNHGLELSPDEQYLFAAGSIANYIAVDRHPTLELVKTIPVGSDPNWIVFSPDSKYAYVGCQGTNEVSIISIDEMKEIKLLKSGGRGTKRLRIVDVPHRRVD